MNESETRFYNQSDCIYQNKNNTCGYIHKQKNMIAIHIWI